MVGSGALLPSKNTVSFLIATFIILEQVVPIESHDCSDEQCTGDQFCCDGECCSYLGRHWYSWIVVVLLVSVIIMTCLFFPRTPTNNETDGAQYFYLLPGRDVPQTYTYQQQPNMHGDTPVYTKKQPSESQPYRYERLVQQTEPYFTSPEPSAPPESPRYERKSY